MERELWLILYETTVRLDKRFGSWKFSTADIVVVYFWSVVHDRPMSWAIQPQHWPDDLRPACLPSQSTLSRRLRHADTQRLMTETEQTCRL